MERAQRISYLQKNSMCGPDCDHSGPPKKEREQFDTEWNNLQDHMIELKRSRKDGWLEQALALQDKFNSKWEKWRRKWFPLTLEKHEIMTLVDRFEKLANEEDDFAPPLHHKISQTPKGRRPSDKPGWLIIVGEEIEFEPNIRWCYQISIDGNNGRTDSLWLRTIINPKRRARIEDYAEKLLIELKAKTGENKKRFIVVEFPEGSGPGIKSVLGSADWFVALLGDEEREAARLEGKLIGSYETEQEAGDKLRAMRVADPTLWVSQEFR